MLPQKVADQLREGKKVEAGMMLTVQAPTGQQIPVKVVKVDDENIHLDMNHPLAGKNLTFKVKIVKVE